MRREAPIEKEEILDTLSDSAEFSVRVHDDNIVLVEWAGTGDGDGAVFVLSEGSLDITSPSDIALNAAQDLALLFNAHVTGEEGEDLSGIRLGHDGPTGDGCGPTVGTVLLIAALIAAYWAFS